MMHLLESAGWEGPKMWERVTAACRAFFWTSFFGTFSVTGKSTIKK